MTSMFEILKFLVDLTVKSLSGFRKFQNQSKHNRLGAALFIIYSDVNEIVFRGRQLIDQLDIVLADIDAGRRPEMESLLSATRAQTGILKRVWGWLHDFSVEFHVVDGSDYEKLRALMWRKGGIVDLIEMHLRDGQLVIGPSQPAIENILSGLSPDGGPPMPGNFTQRGEWSELAFTAESAAVSPEKLDPVNEEDGFQAYYDRQRGFNRKAYQEGIRYVIERANLRRQLDEISEAAESLRAALVEYWKVDEILPLVREERAKFGEPPITRGLLIPLRSPGADVGLLGTGYLALRTAADRFASCSM